MREGELQTTSTFVQIRRREKVEGAEEEEAEAVEEEEEESLFKADAVNEEDPERDRTTGEASSQVSPGRARVMSVAYASQFA